MALLGRLEQWMAERNMMLGRTCLPLLEASALYLFRLSLPIERNCLLCSHSPSPCPNYERNAENL